jgi:hypothetical protein
MQKDQHTFLFYFFLANFLSEQLLHKEQQLDNPKEENLYKRSKNHWWRGIL